MLSSELKRKMNIYQLLNDKFSGIKPRGGFTLIELLIAMSVFSVIGTVALSILFMTLRSSKKSETLIALKQSGSTAVSQFAKNVRYAKSLNSPISCVTPIVASTINVTSIIDEGHTTYACTTGTNATVASNSSSLIDTNAFVVSQCIFTCSQPTLNDPPTIKLSFTLYSKNNSGFLESAGSVPFQTSITLRNYTR